MASGWHQVLAGRAIGVGNGWEAVTIRAVASKLGYTSPLLYEHFRDKKDLLTQIAVDALSLLQTSLALDLPKARRPAAVAMIERYWTFMLENAQLYKLMNGMDGELIGNEAVGQSAQSLCKFIAATLRPLAGNNATEADAMMLTEEPWALLHGMAALYLHRSVPFELERVVKGGLRLIAGSRRRASLNGAARGARP